MAHFAFENPIDAPAAWNEAIAGAWILNGYDHWPIPFERSVSTNEFLLERKGKESALLALLAPDASGSRTICTSTLRPNADPYRILVELARGTPNRLRNLAEAMVASRIPIPVELEQKLRACTANFSKAIASERDEQDRLGTQLIGEVLATSDTAMNFLAERRLRARLEDTPGLKTRFGCKLQSPLDVQASETYCSIFNAVRIEPVWRSIEAVESHFDWSRLDGLVEWATLKRLAITIGPVIDFSAGALPEWLYQQSDLPLLAAFMDDFLGTVVARYRQHATSFQVFSGLNSQDEFDLIEDDRLRLAARLHESTAQIDPRLNWSYSLREPFGDYLRSEQNHYSPLVFSDTLVRSGHESVSVSLDIDSGDPHDALDMLPLLDHFSAIVPKLTVECGGNRRERSPSLSLSLLQTALSCEPIESVFWTAWSKLYDAERGELTPLGVDFQILRARWWEAVPANP